MTDLRRLRLCDHLRPGAHFYLERQHLPSRVGREPQLHRHDFLELYWVESGAELPAEEVGIAVAERRGDLRQGKHRWRVEVRGPGRTAAR